MNPNRFSTNTAATDVDAGRRTFLKVATASSAGMMLGVSLDVQSQANNVADTALEYNAFVSITPDNVVRIYIKHLEMGQGVYTGPSPGV